MGVTNRKCFTSDRRWKRRFIGRRCEASQKELVGVIIGSITRNGSELPQGMQEKRLDCDELMSICRQGLGSRTYGHGGTVSNIK